MTWAAPMTAVAGSVFTAAQFNTYIRDNLNETAPAKATTAGSHFAVSDTNQIAQRTSATANINTGESTSSSAYTALATPGPVVTVTTGVMALVGVSSTLSNNTVGQNTYMSYAVSGATTIAATDDRAQLMTAAAINQAFRASHWYLETGLTAGSNTFTAQYRVTANTGSWSNRRMIVVPF